MAVHDIGVEGDELVRLTAVTRKADDDEVVRIDLTKTKELLDRVSGSRLPN